MSYLAGRWGVNPHVLPTMGREISPIQDLRSFKALKRTIERYRPHIIHTHTAKAGTLGRLAGITMNLRGGHDRRIRMIHTYHGHVFHHYFGKGKTLFFILIERLLGRFTDRIIVLSPLQKDDICKRYKIAREDRVRMIPLGFEVSDFARDNPGEREATRLQILSEISEDTVMVGIIGRLTPVKNHSMLLRAVRILKTENIARRFKFLLIGGGELRDALMREARVLGVQDQVIFTGWLRDMPSIYRALDVVALTSLNEGTPVTLIEAMASGVPVVATEVGGVGDLMGDVTRRVSDGYSLTAHGMMVPSNGEEALAKALRFCLENREVCKEMATRARDFVLERYSMERLTGDLESLYGEVLTIQG
jgi:glycosyltransferase involved in cell wall biosynthesis